MRISLLFSLALALLLGASASFAQADLKANVPFDFRAGKQELPAGLYTIDIDNSGLLWFQGYRKGANAVVHSYGVGGPSSDHPSMLIFHRYGNTYFLSEVWKSGRVNGRQVKSSPMEEQLARNITPSRTTLIASKR